MLHGGKLPFAYEAKLNKVLEINNNHLGALSLQAMVYFHKGNIQQAVKLWNKIKEHPNTTDSERQSISEMIEYVDNKPKQIVNNKLIVEVNVATDLVKKYSADTPVFVYAKKTIGMPAPLAVVKLKLKDMPAVVELDNSSAMLPNHNLDSAKEVVVGARLAVSGQPIAQIGDWQSETDNIILKSGVQHVNVTIKSQLTNN